MFASLIINHITVNAGRELALSVQAFFMSADIVSIFIKIWHLGTPVYALNGRTAFTVECDKQRVRPGCFFYYTLCYKINSISTAHCLAPARRPLTKRALCQPYLTLTLISTVWVSTFRTSRCAICANPVRTVWPSREPSTSAESIIQPVLRTCPSSWPMYWNATKPSKPVITGARTASRNATCRPTSTVIRTLWCCRLTSRNYSLQDLGFARLIFEVSRLFTPYFQHQSNVY